MGTLDSAGIRMRRGTAVWALAGLVVLVCIEGTLACSCWPQTREQSFCRADAVFIGRVVRIIRKNRRNPWDQTNVFVVQVDEVLKLKRTTGRAEKPELKQLSST